MNFYKKEIHGGNIELNSKRYSIDKDKLIDFSSNINPMPILEGIKSQLINSIDSINNYPDPNYLNLKFSISKYINLSEDYIVVGNGATEIIYLLFEYFKFKQVLIPAPTFCEYENAIKRYGGSIKYFFLNEKEEFCLDVDELISYIENKKLDAIVICNPNNPTSKMININDIKKLILYLLNKRIYLIVDESFIELTCNKDSVSDLVEIYKNLFVIRSFTKIFSVPGIRLGYGISNKNIIGNLNNFRLPWSINSFASEAFNFINNCEYFFKELKIWLVNEKQYMYEQLSKIDYLKVFKPDSNFLLVKITDDKINLLDLKDYLGYKGLLIRDAGNFKGLNNNFFRVAVKDRNKNKILIQTINSYE